MGEADKQPLISVIVPIYNVEPYLRTCVDSILNQTYTNLEIILVDDGSPDRCPAICDEYAEKDPRIRVIHKKNGGASAARNDGIKSSKGEYLLFIDSDDWVDSEWIRQLYNAIGNNDFIIAGVTYIFGSVQHAVMPDNMTLFELVKNSLFGYTWNKLYKKKSFENLEYYSGLREDLLLNLTLVNSGKIFTTVNYTGYYYLQRKNSLIHQKNSPPVQTVFDFENRVRRAVSHLPEKDKIYNCVLYSYVTDYLYKVLLTENLTEKEIKQIYNSIILCNSLRKNLMYQYADNTLFRILFIGIMLRSSTLVMCGYKLCQKL